MARTDKDRGQDKTVQNGIDSEAQGYPRTRRADDRILDERQVRNMTQRFLRNEQLVGWTSIIFGGVLLFNALGFFPLFNYLLGAMSVALLVYGAWKINLVRKTQDAINWFQGYLEDNTKDRNKDNRKNK